MSSNKISMRDSFFDKLYEIAKEDKKVMVVSADMGAPSLDKFREDLKEQYFNCGIAESNMVSISAGLAKEGMNVFAYAIAPFISSRPYEFIKLDACLMDSPITLVGVGTGFGYDDSGPTHHTTEDISILRTLPNLKILSPSDNVSASAFAEYSYKSQHPIYLRLDREILPNLYSKKDSFLEGFKELKNGEKNYFITTGNMVHKALEVSGKLEKEGIDIGVIDLYCLNPLPGKQFTNFLDGKRIISLEEHLLAGGMGSSLTERIVDNGLNTKMKRIGLEKYIYAYGGRENIREESGIGTQKIINTARNFFQ